ncbi:NAD(P)-dependent glycerol-3-phosphate dehydrogenase [bacterium]|nr:NAD(P)-dependent glycerol-3-phosphate dehydrogenase [bacterium]MBU1598802.1 NAD(P)-dependent glycerol-3-phosphate dehydrogenase [bacterium]MBU2461957.1 NAD(P)-dependent glycerol-3-phosphate dehydrogenase [bacterium]
MKIGVLGGGSWGLALACLLAEKGEVIVWEYNQDLAERIRRTRENPISLPGVTIPSVIEITSKIDCLAEAEVIVCALPSWAIRDVFSKMKGFLNEDALIVSCSKGIEEETFMRPSEVICDVLSERRRDVFSKMKGFLKEDALIVSCSKGIEEETFMRPSEVISDLLSKKTIVALSGPSHAEEVAQKIPTAVVSSSRNEKDMQFVQRLFSSSFFRVYTNPDIIGVELGGGLKNIIAIAGGISDGLGFGDNTRAALFCRGIMEMAKIGVAAGGVSTTFFGLAGIGDLMVTMTSKHSRNRRFGELIGKGRCVEDALSEVKMVVEGFKTTQATFHLAKERRIETPITDEVYYILFEGKDPSSAVKSLLNRELKEE